MQYDESSIELIRETLFVTLRIAVPLLLSGMLIGLLISLIQSITSIQDQTLTFVPKIVAVFGVFGALFPWMMQMMMEFSVRVLDVVASQGGP